MKTIRFTVPPTAHVGSYASTCSASYGETYRQNALSDYNSCRAHDGIAPVSRMPAGTNYEIPPAPYYIQRKGDGYLETVGEFDTRGEAREMLAEYRMSDPSAEYYISRRACREWND